ncbi:MAG: FCD domain-containing protein [Amylibacter sp.]|jgi:GntR family transcriptional repressor for pyruvate dehydrogenase complex|tara:strand:+ start:10414 stop:11181 length:768 start_codon:yes stop_codon:yes gene_type:complete
MPFQKIELDRVAVSVIIQIEQLILRGIIRPGERLPSERDLAERMGVSRPSLREAISALQDKGLLTTKANAGVFVAELLGAPFSAPLTDLFSTHDEAVFDYISFRSDLEGMAAERAANLGSGTDLKVIKAIFDKMQTAHELKDPDQEASLDAEFHMAIIEASHNVFLLHMVRSMFEMLKKGVFYNRQIMFSRHTTRGALLEQHRAICNAIQNRNPKAARKAAEDHMDFIKTCMEEVKKAEANEEIAKLRLDHTVAS